MPIQTFFIAVLFFFFGFFLSGSLYVYSARRMEIKSRSEAEIFCFCAVNAMLCTLFGLKFSAEITYLFPCVFAITLLSAISLCDEKSGYIPDEFLFLFFLAGISVAASGSLIDNLTACLLCGIFFLLLYVVSRCIFGMDGIGRGDVALIAFAGLFLGRFVGMALGFGVIFAACGIILRTRLSPSAVCGLPLSGPENEPYFPLAPSLAAGVFLVAFCGGDIIAAILAPFGVAA